MRPPTPEKPVLPWELNLLRALVRFVLIIGGCIVLLFVSLKIYDAVRAETPDERHTRLEDAKREAEIRRYRK